jgi:hypothetical protein
MPFLFDVQLHGLLPVPEVCMRYRAGDIAWKLFVPALLGRLAQDLAEFVDDDDPKRDRLLSIAFGAEDRLQSRLQIR